MSHLGVEDARGDGVNQHATAGELGCQGAGYLQHAALGGEVADLYGAGLDGTDGGDVDHAAVTLRAEERGDFAGHQEHAGEVGGDDLVPLLGGVVFELVVLAHTGVVDEDVDATALTLTVATASTMDCSLDTSQVTGRQRTPISRISAAILSRRSARRARIAT